MIECVIMGDSIAQGVARFRPTCAQITQQGVNSLTFNNSLIQSVNARYVLISLGSNDVGTPDLPRHLAAIRSRIQSREVTWLLSVNNPQAAAQVQQIARAHGDRVVHVRAVVGPDGVHPSTSGYHRLNQMWRPL
jgi:lysophospholipase L1-like esterase